MPRTKTVRIEDRLTAPSKDDLASAIQRMFLETGAGPRPVDARGLSDVIHGSDSGSIAGDTEIAWRWDEREGRRGTDVLLSVAHRTKESA